MELKLYIRQNPIYNLNNQPIYYAGNSPFNLVQTVGTLPTARQWQNYGQFIDVTEHVSDLSQLQLTWSIQRDEAGNISAFNEIKKSASGQLTFEGLAYDLIKSWLIEDVSASLNSVEVMIRDTSCGDFRGYVVKSNDIQWCEDGICQYSVILKQQDEQITCIKRTFISDNWQGWFPENGVPANSKRHPRFGYCVEQRPNGMMIALWYIMGQTIAPMAALIIIALVPLLNSLIFAINGIILAINTIPGINVQPINFINPSAVLDSFTVYFVETAGCGREYPAPLIRDYITNVCDKCGITVNAQTAPLFFADNLTVNTSTGVETFPNEYKNACYLHPETQRGIRRFDGVNILGNSPMNTTTFWQPRNAPPHTLSTFLNLILPTFNHEWRISNGELIIGRKDEMYRTAYVYDFREGAADRSKLVEGVCFEPTGEKYPASCKGIYTTDAMDSNEAGGANGTGQMNGVVNFVAIDPNNNNKAVNPNFEGILSKNVNLGATKFNLDGASGCYYYDALQQLANAGIFNLTSLFQTGVIAGAMHEYGSYALLLQNELTQYGKIIIWDGQSYLNARALITKAAWDGISPHPMPDINTKYNENNEAWKVKHTPDTKVIGSNLVISNAPPGIYRAANFFGGPISEHPALLPNYPMYFEPNFKGTLWDRFHWIDDPNQAQMMNYNWRCKIELCCEDLKKLGMLDMATGILLNERVHLPFGYYQTGYIKEITASYKPDEQQGRYIELRGKL